LALDNSSVYYFWATYQYKFDPLTNDYTRLDSNLPYSSVSGSAIRYKNLAFIFAPTGASSNHIIPFDMESESSAVDLGTLPGSFSSIAAVEVGDGEAWLFRNTYYQDDPKLPPIRFDMETKEVSYRIKNNPLPRFRQKPAVVWDGNKKLAFIVGGYGPTSGDESSNSTRTDGIYQFNPKDLSTTFLPVGGEYPGSPDGVIFDDTAAVFIEELNRIYIFGGKTREGDKGSVSTSSIWYIDLPLD
jgi:N-acetylneuraminic acid mutarotase